MQELELITQPIEPHRIMIATLFISEKWAPLKAHSTLQGNCNVNQLSPWQDAEWSEDGYISMHKVGCNLCHLGCKQVLVWVRIYNNHWVVLTPSVTIIKQSQGNAAFESRQIKYFRSFEWLGSCKSLHRCTNNSEYGCRVVGAMKGLIE
jgi:hypothetical protein